MSSRNHQGSRNSSQPSGQGPTGGEGTPQEPGAPAAGTTPPAAGTTPPAAGTTPPAEDKAAKAAEKAAEKAAKEQAATTAALTRIRQTKERLRAAMVKAGVSLPDKQAEEEQHEVEAEVWASKEKDYRIATAGAAVHLADDLDAVLAMSYDELMAVNGMLAGVTADVSGARANVIIAAWRMKAWRKAKKADGKTPLYKDWADFCKKALGVTTSTPILDEAQKAIIVAMYNKEARVHPTSADMAAACGVSVRTIDRRKEELKYVDPQKAQAGRDAQKHANQERRAKVNATGEIPVAAGSATVSIASMAAFCAANIDAENLAAALGEPYTEKVAKTLSASRLRELADLVDAGK